MTWAEGSGDTALCPTELPKGARELRGAARKRVFSPVRGCHGDRSRRGHPLVWPSIAHLYSMSWSEPLSGGSS